MDAGETGRAHQPGDPLAGTVEPGVAQLGVDPGHAVGAPAAGVDPADLAGQGRVGGRARQGRRARQA